MEPKMSCIVLVSIENPEDISNPTLLVQLCRQLVAKNGVNSAQPDGGDASESKKYRIITDRRGGHGILEKANVPHDHVDAQDQDTVQDDQIEAIIAVTKPKDVEEMKKASYVEIANLVRKLAMKPEQCVVVTNEIHLPLLCRGPENVSSEMRLQMASIALNQMSDINSKIAESFQFRTSEKNKRVLIIGGGGREHALALKLAESSLVEIVYVLAAHDGYQNGKVKYVCDVSQNDNEACVDYAKKLQISLVVVGPEVPLVNGISDAMKAAGISCFGPSKLAARLEGSKAFSKAFMERHSIPTAKYKSFVDYESALEYLENTNYPIVIKVSGLAAGKGVFLPETMQESKETLKKVMLDKSFGQAGNEVVIEERLLGEEVSILGLCDGKSVVLLPGAQDHKRVFEEDKGPNTGGMGAYAPAPILTPELRAHVSLNVMQKAVDGARSEGFPFVGVLYAGIIVTPNGPMVLEFNARFGDPETQVCLPLVESDLYGILLDCVDGCVLASDVQVSNAHCATVVLASAGYPGAYEKGLAITEESKELEEQKITVYHAGTRTSDGKLVTNGGRVLNVTAKREQGLQQALDDIYKAMDSKLVGFKDAHFRRDIGKRALRPRIKIGILGSTRGTDLQYLLDARDQGFFRADIRVVISNKRSAYIVQRAKEHGLKTVCHSMKGCANRTEFDAQVTKTLKEHDVDLVLLIGYMRILSDQFVDDWENRVLNVHPSLLPEFAGGMDTDVHQAVIDAKRSETGCTIHLVTKVVDGGPIIVQKRCPVYPETDTSDKLKARVQAMEGPAFIEALNRYIDNDFAF